MVLQNLNLRTCFISLNNLTMPEIISCSGTCVYFDGIQTL